MDDDQRREVSLEGLWMAEDLKGDEQGYRLAQDAQSPGAPQEPDDGQLPEGLRLLGLTHGARALGAALPMKARTRKRWRGGRSAARETAPSPGMKGQITMPISTKERVAWPPRRATSDPPGRHPEAGEGSQEQAAAQGDLAPLRSSRW